MIESTKSYNAPYQVSYKNHKMLHKEMPHVPNDLQIDILKLYAGKHRHDSFDTLQNYASVATVCKLWNLVWTNYLDKCKLCRELIITTHSEYEKVKEIEFIKKEEIKIKKKVIHEQRSEGVKKMGLGIGGMIVTSPLMIAGALVGGIILGIPLGCCMEAYNFDDEREHAFLNGLTIGGSVGATLGSFGSFSMYNDGYMEYKDAKK